MAAQITVRRVPKELARRLARLAKTNGQSINATVLALLERATGIDDRRQRLARYTDWSRADVEELDRDVRDQRTIGQGL